MTETMKTTLFVLGAAGLLTLSFILAPGSREPEIFRDEGEEFFPEFTDPNAATTLEVMEYSEASAERKVFRVEKKDGVWTIPSHHHYPADAEERMATAAGLVIGLRKESIRSFSPDEHAAFGVLDPSDPAVDGKSSGKLVTFSDEGGNTLASLIVGKEVEGKTDRRYVRVPGKKRTYVAQLPGEISTKFNEWIETDLLKLDSYKLKELFFDTYSIDEEAGVRLPGEQMVLKKPDLDWELEGLSETEELDKEKVNETVRALDQLKIVGVRPKPSGLAEQLAAGKGIRLGTQDLISLQTRGFYVINGSFHANEGDLHAMTKDGAVYTLRFGEVLYGVGEDVTAGRTDEGEPESPEAPEGAAANRFLMVTVAFDPDLLEKPEGEPLPKEHLDNRQAAREQIESIQAAIETYRTAHDDTLPENLEQLTEGDDPPLEELPSDPWGTAYAYSQDEGGFVVSSYAEDGSPGGEGVNADIASDRLNEEEELKTLAQKFEDYQEKLKTGQEEVDELRARFAPWYYVVDDESFKKLHLTRAQVVKEKETTDGEDTGSDD